jgi:hypothetical protein
VGRHWLDSDGLLAAAYVAAGLTCLVVGVRERRRRGHRWPAFWFVSAAVLAAVGIARAGKLGAMITRAGRDRARAEGWYAGRHDLQVIVIAALGVVWLGGVGVMVWRTRRQHRHCLPVAVAVIGLLTFLAVRLVSLHQVDRLFGRRAHGVRLGSLAELGGTALVAVLALVAAATAPRRGRSRDAPVTAPTTR